MNDRFVESREALSYAREALKNGAMAEARQWAERSAELAPQSEDPWLILAAVASPGESLDYIRKALALNPDSPRAKKGMEWALQRLGETPKSKVSLQNENQAEVKPEAQQSKDKEKSAGKKNPKKRSLLLPVLLGLMGANNDGGDFPAPAADGYYTLTVNLADLTFTMVPYAEGATAKRYATIGVIGDATPTGWDSDTDMVETLPHIWVIQKINLIAGKTIKFRADNDWADNWGIGTTTNNIPFGVSSNGGDNFTIEKGGEYLLVLNDLTKHYMIIRTEKLP